MPFRKRKSSAISRMNQRIKRRGFNSRVVARRPKIRGGSALRTVSLNYHRFSRYGDAGTFSVNTTEGSVDFDFSLSKVINYSEFTALFDQFKITKVVFKVQLINNPDAFGPVNTSVAGTNNQNNWFPKLWYIRDYDGGASETISSMKERVGARFFVMRPNKEYSIALSPCVAVQTYKTATTTGYGPRRMWLDMANGAAVPHYGLKTVVDCLGLDPADSTGFQFRWEVKYYISFKGVR